MAARFTVLASGSSGNACLLQADGFGLLIDCGIGPRRLAGRMAACGLGWRHVHAVVLTHTHSDHWYEPTLAHIARLGLPVHCHPSHAAYLTQASPAFAVTHAAGRVRLYDATEQFIAVPGLTCRPLAVLHDGGPTFGFRFEGAHGLYGPTWSVAYAADLGCWDESLARALADVDLLALEFNHDVEMQRRSGRPYPLIHRILGDEGHLSNEQAAGLLRAAIAASGHACLRHVIPLHLSRDCNRPTLARAAALAALQDAAAVGVHLHAPDRGGPSLTIGVTPPPKRRAPRRVENGRVHTRLWDEAPADPR
jgi:ribonuclease BN (tRNA processing enzyme)